MKPIADYHVHTSLCGHAVGTMAEYVESAQKSGLEYVGFADHIPLGPDFENSHTMHAAQLPSYFEEIKHLKELYPEIQIYAGAEIGLYAGFENELRSLRSRYPFDYIIGSVHYFGNLFVFQSDVPILTEEETADEIKAYFDLYEQGVRSGLIDIVGHIDALKCIFPNNLPIIQQRIENLLTLISEAGIIMEVNTSGLRKRSNEIFPAEHIIDYAACKNLTICLGSDAHMPEHVGLEFSRVEDILRKYGYSSRPGNSKFMNIYYPS